MIEYAADLRSHGFDRARLSRVTERIERDLDDARYHGIALRVSRDGVPILSMRAGTDGVGGALRDDSVFCLMSLTKVITAVLTLRMAEDGWFALTTPLSTAIPELGPDAAAISVYHVLTQTSGFPIDTPDVPADVVADLERYAAEMFGFVPASAPGARAAYSARIAHSVLALFLQRIGGRPFVELVSDLVTRPLGMNDTAFGPEERHAGRRVPLSPAPYLRDDLRSVVDGHIAFIDDFSLRPGAVVPASNAFAPIDDVHRLTSALLSGRDPHGRVFLSAPMLELVARNHTGDLVNDLVVMTLRERDLVEYPAYLAMGFWGRGTGMVHGAFGLLTSERTFGGLGRGTNVLWVDPARRVTLTALTAGLMDEADNLQRFSAISDLVMSSVEDEPYAIPADVRRPAGSLESR